MGKKWPAILKHSFFEDSVVIKLLILSLQDVLTASRSPDLHKMLQLTISTVNNLCLQRLKDRFDH